MNDSVKPEWMRKKQAEQEAVARTEDLRQQRIVAAELLIGRDGQKFWKELKEKLAIAVEFLPDLKLSGSISPTGDDAIRILVNKPGVCANQTYTDLFYNREAKEVRCGILNGGMYSLGFCVVTNENRVAVISSRQPGVMDPEAAAQHVMEKMMDCIDSQA
ncbi:MAG: hypothetical protein WA485_15810 [Candidatus Sulfotelmatobacter sp.]